MNCPQNGLQIMHIELPTDVYSVSQSHEVHPNLFTVPNSQFPIP
ncbi:hypothetical protein PN497_25425 [Sphaerospermopsis kisseleviana CS-549]|uniref:Uncharacterized protein n=1 Tax=Sphaerospermopsis kisseleviana CS-549 TaxID=3021783 RepID=A0ABT5A181_9CYAN|nr:hypothetical protein [Sphaerospermopsis kisseleviana]MDB9444667.1 hypothetical protein [Sphaerospermopsis kisseleviana CS-549]BAZ81480.1 hypothetical protein NIES73_27480 [Sphaerospermopsis kisseleviana NIES-73]